MIVALDRRAAARTSRRAAALPCFVGEDVSFGFLELLSVHGIRVTRGANRPPHLLIILVVRISAQALHRVLGAYARGFLVNVETTFAGIEVFRRGYCRQCEQRCEHTKQHKAFHTLTPIKALHCSAAGDTWTAV